MLNHIRDKLVIKNSNNNKIIKILGDGQEKGDHVFFLHL